MSVTYTIQILTNPDNTTYNNFTVTKNGKLYKFRNMIVFEIFSKIISGKHWGTLKCHLLQDLKVPSSNLNKD